MSDTQDRIAIATDIETKDVVQAEIYHNFERLEGIQQEWDEFVESVGCEIFLTYDWCRIWWKYYGKNRDLRIFIFRSDNKLVGIIPLFFEKLWLGPVFVRAAKIVGSDFTLSQFSVPLDNGYMPAVIEKFSELISKDRWDIIHIGPIAGLYNHFDDLTNTINEFFGVFHSVLVEDKNVQTYFQLAENWEKQLAILKKGERWDIKRSYKALHAQANGLVSVVASKENYQNI